MASITNLIRRVLLIGNGLTFLVIAVGVLLSPNKAAYIYGYTLDGADGVDEFFAVYIGFWIGLTILFFISAWKLELTLLGDIAFLMILLQSLGRVLSFALDGKPSERFIIAFCLEFSTSLLGLLMRPRPVQQT